MAAQALNRASLRDRNCRPDPSGKSWRIGRQIGVRMHRPIGKTHRMPRLHTAAIGSFAGSDEVRGHQMAIDQHIAGRTAALADKPAFAIQSD